MSIVIKNLFHYPIKSFLGEQCQTLDINKRGVCGDRLFALLDEKNNVLSAKKNAKLFQLAAFHQNNQLMIRLSNNKVVSAESDNINALLSEQLGQTVRLLAEQNTSHFDDSPIHIISTDGLDSLQQQLPECQITMARFRANIVVSGLSDFSPYLGKTVHFANTALKLNKLTPRCVMVTHAQSELSTQKQILSHLYSNDGGCFGVYATVIKGGQVHCGDVLT